MHRGVPRYMPRIRQQGRTLDVLAGFALLSGLLPWRLLAQFKLFGQAIALSFLIGLSFFVLVAILLILVSGALWLATAAAVWYRKRIGLLFLTILCALRSAIGALCV